MIKSLMLLSSVVALAGISSALAGDEIARELRVKTGEQTDVCGENSEYFKRTGKTCGLKKVWFKTIDHSLQADDDQYPYYGTLAYAGFEANSWKDLTQYGYVQYIRGCTYESKMNARGEIEKRVGQSIHHLGVRRTLTFPEWSFDATSTDPLYYGPSEEDSDLKGGRLALYQWTPRLGALNKKVDKDLHQVLRMPAEKRKQLKPALYVIDSPSMAFQPTRSLRVFQNVALEFRMCLYRLEDIPLAVTSDEPLSATPIVCHDWESQFEFNFDKDEFELKAGKGQDPFCATQQPRPPAS